MTQSVLRAALCSFASVLLLAPLRFPSAPSSTIVTSSFVPPGCCLICFRLPFCPSGSQSVADLLLESVSTGTVRELGIDHLWMTLGRRIFHRNKMALEFCCVVEDETTSWADGVRKNVDDRIVKPTSINHASVVFFCSCHVFSGCLHAGMSRSAPETLICDHQACHSLRFSMRSHLCVTLMCSQRSCRRPTLTTFPPSSSSNVQM